MFTVRECNVSEWRKFSKYHYLSHDIHKGAKCYGLYDGDVIIGFIGVLHFPHARNKKIKRVTRLVILPDYQGIGLGRQFLNIVGDQYIHSDYDFMIQTSAKNLISALVNDDKWLLQRYGHAPKQSKKFANTTSEKRITASFARKRAKQ